jgi:inner membrane protein
MIIGHLPSGYLLGRVLRVGAPVLMFAVILGAIFPDFDLLFFYLVDDRGLHHHRYWVHAPGFWVLVSLVVAPLLWWVSRPMLALFAAFVAGNFLHVVLDTITGGIMWLWPYSTNLLSLMTVRPTHSHFVLSYMAHWTFWLEIALWISAVVIYVRRRRHG